MRTTVNFDPNVYSFILAYSGGKGITLSAAVNELVRRAEVVSEPESGSESSRLVMNEYGYLEIVGTGHVLTSEMVKELSEDEIV